jgi:hypothetical protein
MSGNMQAIPANHLSLCSCVLYFVRISPSPFPCLFDMPGSSVLAHKNLYRDRSAWLESIIPRLAMPPRSSAWHCYLQYEPPPQDVFPNILTESSLASECSSKWSRHSLIKEVHLVRNAPRWLASAVGRNSGIAEESTGKQIPPELGR